MSVAKESIVSGSSSPGVECLRNVNKRADLQSAHNDVLSSKINTLQGILSLEKYNATADSGKISAKPGNFKKVSRKIRSVISQAINIAKKNPNTISCVINLVTLLFQPASGMMALADLVTNVALKKLSNTSTNIKEQKESNLVSRFATKIANFQKKHTVATNVIRVVISVALQTAIGIALCASPIFILLTVWHICFDAIISLLTKLPPIKHIAEAFPTAFKIISTMISIGIQTVIGAVTGTLAILAVNAVYDIATTIFEIYTSKRSTAKTLQNSTIGDGLIEETTVTSKEMELKTMMIANSTT